MTKIRSMLALAAILATVVGGTSARATTACTDLVDATASTSAILGAPGRYAAPATEPTALVVFAHGYRNRSDSWEPHLRSAARDHGVLAVAMDNSSTGPAPDNRGWTVVEGANESIAAAKHFLDACPELRTRPVVIFGISMGANTSGLAVAAGETNPYTGGPLFDHWISVEGALNAPETYLAGRAAATTGDPYIVGAVQDFEALCGTIEANPGCYRSLSVVARTDEVADSGVESVILVHGLADGLVPYNQSREMATSLRALGVPTDMVTVLRRNDWQNPSSAGTEGGTTGDGHVTSRIGGGTDLRPLAGHGWEGSTTHIVIRTGFERLWALLEDGIAGADRESVVDSDLGTLP